MKKKFTILSIIFFISSCLLAQTGTIKGVVTNLNNNEKVFGANVFVEVNGVMKGQSTDPDGKYTIKPLNPGTYNVKAKVMGYKPVLLSKVEVTSDNITYLNIELEPTAIEIPEYEVIVWKEPLIRIDEPTVQTLPVGQLKNDPNIKNPIKMLNNLAGVTVSENNEVYVRGSRPQSTDFYVDGVKSINGDIGIPGQAIGSMKVYTGGIPALYGDVTGGVVVIETKSYFDLLQQSKK